MQQSKPHNSDPDAHFFTMLDPDTSIKRMRIRNSATMYFQHSAAVCAVCTALAHKMTHTIKNRPHVPVGVKGGGKGAHLAFSGK